MSLFYSPREVRGVAPRKRKKDDDCDNNIQITELYGCSWCADEYDSESELNVHKRVKHRRDLLKMIADDLVCKMCITKYEDQEKLIKHIKTDHLLSSEDAEHVQREIFICDICNTLYFNKAMLALHMQAKHDPEHRFTLSDTCPKCNKNIQIRHIWFHFQRHAIQSVSCCQICLKKCNNRSDLQKHVSLVHPGYFRCTICLYETRTKEFFSTHIETHNSNLHLSPNIGIDESLLWRCFTHKQSSRSIDLSFSMRGVKLNGVFICILCRAVCNEEDKAAHIAKYHLVNIVASRKQYACSCGDQFFNSVLLKHHVFKMKGDHRAC